MNCNRYSIYIEYLIYFAANRETEEVTGLEFMTDAQDEEAQKILKG